VLCLKFTLPVRSTKLCSLPDVQKEHNILSRCRSRSHKHFSVSIVCHSLDLCVTSTFIVWKVQEYTKTLYRVESLLIRGATFCLFPGVSPLNWWTPLFGLSVGWPHLDPFKCKWGGIILSSFLTFFLWGMVIFTPVCLAHQTTPFGHPLGCLPRWKQEMFCQVSFLLIYFVSLDLSVSCAAVLYNHTVLASHAVWSYF
jgi:hypothetical protein